MVLKLGRFSTSVIACVKLNRQQERRLIMHYQKKYFTSMAPVEKNPSIFIQKIDKFLEWYDEITGMDEVRMAHKKVLEEEENFKRAQECRREVLNQLTDVQQRLKDLYVEIENTSRSDERYVTLVTQEHKLLKEEKAVMEAFSRAEKQERDSFAILSSSVKHSHEKERAQSERTKYWSVIGSILGTALGILGSSINNHFKMSELKQLVKSSTNKQLMDSLSNYTENNEKIMEKYKNINITEINKISKVEEVLNKIDKRLIDIEDNFKNIEKEWGKNVSKPCEHKCILESVPNEEEWLEKRYTQGKVLLFTVTLLTILVSIVSRNG